MESVSTEGVTIKVEPKETISVTTKLFVSEEGVLCGNEKLEPQEHPFITADTKNEEDSDNVDVKFEHKFLHGENEGEDTIFVSEGSALYTGSEPINEDRESAPESSDTKCFVDVKFEEEFLHDENVSVGTNLFSKDSALCTGSKPIKEENKSAPKSSDTKRRQEGRDDDNCKRRKLESDPEPASLTKEEVQTTDDEDDGHEQSGQALTPSPGHPRAPSPSPRLARHEVVDTQAYKEGSEESDESDGGTPPSAPSAKPLSSKAPASKKKRTYSILPEEKEMAVAEWYREHELLYNKKLWAYRDRERKDIAYRQMATEINVTVDELHKWLESMRTRYSKLFVLKSGQETKSLTEREHWIRDTFHFLRPHIVRCPTRRSKLYKGGPVSQASQPSQTTQDEEAVDDLVELATPPAAATAPRAATVDPPPATVDPALGTTQAERDLLNKLREAESRQLNINAAWRGTHLEETPLMTEVRLFHQLLTASFKAVERRHVEHYMLEGLRLVTGMNNYALGIGSIPRVVINEPNQPLQPPPALPQPYEPRPLPGPSHYKLPSAPGTPSGWRTRAPTYGRPDATRVEPPRSVTPRLSDIANLDRYLENAVSGPLTDFTY